MAHALGSFIEFEDAKQSKAIVQPERARKKSVSIRSPTDQELDDLVFGAQIDGPQSDREPRSGQQTPYSGAQTPYTGFQTPITPSNLEQSTPADATPLVQTLWNPPMNKWRVLCACLVYFGNGLNDAAPGALIPYMESWYGIGYALVSLIFLTNAAGFIVAAFFTDATFNQLGRARTLVLSELIMIGGYVIMLCTPPWAAVVVSFFFLGYGAAINLALNNVFCSNLQGSTVILGFAHGSYGIGGTVGPIMATAIASHGVAWSRFYSITLGIRVACVVFNAWAFWNHEKEGAVRLLAELERTAANQSAEAQSGGDGAGNAVEQRQPKLALLKEALRNRTTLMGALFIFAYQGAEVAISGWVISFLIAYRDGDPAQVGYVTAGFFGGITLGRFTLTHVAHRFGERLFVYLLGVGAIAFQLLVWLVPNVVGNAVAVSIVGLLLGPIYPCAQTIFSRLLPRKLQMSAVGFIASAGSSGGAVAPFLTGLLAQAVGTYVLHPVCIGLFVIMLGCWRFLPEVDKRSE